MRFLASKYTNMLLLLPGAILIFVLERYFSFYFFFQEQSHLFPTTSAWLMEQITKLSGLSIWLEEFTFSLYQYPYAGTCFTLIAAFAITWGIDQTVKTIANKSAPILILALPALTAILIITDKNFFIRGIYAYLAVLLCIWLFLKYTHSIIRWVIAIIAPLILFYTTEAGAMLFASSILLLSIIYKKGTIYPSAIALLVALVCGVITVQLGLTIDYGYAFGVSNFYEQLLSPDLVVILWWAMLPVVIAIGTALAKPNDIITQKLHRYWVVSPLVQIALLCAMFQAGMGMDGARRLTDVKIMEIDCYARSHEWAKVENRCNRRKLTDIEANYLNLALLKQGKLLDNMFYFNQQSPNSLVMEWNEKTHIEAAALSDVHFGFGDMASAQHFAFEGLVSSRGYSNPRMLERLIQTNLIYGHYAVAEKYCLLLQQGIGYRQKAEHYLALAKEPKRIKEDLLLYKRRQTTSALPSSSFVRGAQIDLMNMAEASKENHEAIDYLAAIHLLTGNLYALCETIDLYRNRQQPQPLAVQEGLLAFFESKPEMWSRYGITSETQERYELFRESYLRSQETPNGKAYMFKHFGNTYWYYYQYVRST